MLLFSVGVELVLCFELVLSCVAFLSCSGVVLLFVLSCVVLLNWWCSITVVNLYCVFVLVQKSSAFV
mgnify:CR=1 FL=1